VERKAFFHPESGTGQTFRDFCDRVIDHFLRKGAQMTDYRVYVVGNDGHFVRAIQLDCADDNAAIESAKQFIDGFGVELWQRDRRIAGLGTHAEIRAASGSCRQQ
jgi:hypothetical protein